MNSQDNILKCLGLVTQYSSLAVQAGSLTKADNAVIDRENVLENRRGYHVYGALSNQGTQLLTYSNRSLVHNGSKLSYDDGTGIYSDYSGSYNAPAGVKMRSVLARNNLYVTTSTGVKVFSDVAGTAARLAGAPRSLDPSYTLTGSSGFMANNAQAAYRCVVVRTDANNNTITGYPSQRMWASNSSGGSRNTILKLFLTTDALVNDTVQFYRTNVDTTGATTDTSGDSMKLAYQQTITSTDISNGYVTFTDSIVDALLGAELYTNTTQEGIAQANAIPPLCTDLAFYRSSYMCFSNTQTKQRLYITLVGTSSLTGNTVTLSGTTYSFASSENSATGQVKVSATGTAAVDIDVTARSFVHVVNQYSSNTSVYAYYISSSSDLPGKILIEERGVGASAYTMAVSNTAISGMWDSQPPVSPTVTSRFTSSNEVFTNRLYYSKSDQPEHIPLLNYLPVGPSNTRILRIAALRDSLVIIKEEGVYRMTGDSPTSFVVVPLDLTVFCKALDSVVVLQNTVYFLSNQGVVSVSDTGVAVVSRDIEDQLRPIISFSNTPTYTNACGYESDRSYVLSTVSSGTDSAPNQIFRMNTFTKTWTRWTFGFNAAIVEPSSDKMFFTKPGDTNVYRERKNFEQADYADPEHAVTINSISGTSVNFSITDVTPIAGWALSQGGTTIATTSIVANGSTFDAVLVFAAPDSWTTGAGFIFPNVGFDIEWNNWSAAQPGLLKQVQQIEILTDDLTGKHNTTSLTATFHTDLDQNIESTSIDSSSYKWGAAPWGGFPWGGVSDSNSYPTWPPINKSYGRLFTFGVQLAQAQEHCSLCGLSITFSVVSEKVSK